MTTLPAGLTGKPDISVEYEVYQEDVMVASSNSLLDAEHYAEQYRQDGPVELVTCVRIPGLLAAAPGTPPASAQDDAKDERQAFEKWLDRRGVWPALCHEEVFFAGWNARPSTAPAAGDARADRDAAFEAVRKRLCALPRYSFWIGDHGGVKRVEDRSGSWIDIDAAHELFDPVAVDAAIAAQQGKGGNDA
ncbi:hypothetical protein [Achromobacter anxifer]|uniref:hypothetical protein n=1 Tax=Achromobacter anxifer TaxID=1287737 RepID=UPI0023F89B28|nr:hypothetical protein [Achromobacter anxifer]MDF8361907.1 hypothetical protein [Achromobacter anxifer]